MVFFLFSWQEKIDLFSQLDPQEAFPFLALLYALGPESLLEQLKLEMLALTRGCSKTFTFQNDALN